LFAKRSRRVSKWAPRQPTNPLTHQLTQPHFLYLPIDDPEVLALISPRPVLVIAPRFDRYAAPSLVRAGISRARQVYTRDGAPEALWFESPLDFNRFPAASQRLMFDWLAQVNATAPH